MKLFSCQACGQLLYFENVQCIHCGRTLGYLPDIARISALESLDGGGWKTLAAPEKAYKFCNNARFGVCNWMVPADDAAGFCAACRHNHVIPDLNTPGNDLLWAKLEGAKHRLFYTLLRLRLPLENRAEKLDAFRAEFGDERADYDEALKQHYENGAPPNWQEDFVSVYATTHPWEDFAETWAHYLHIVDTLETASSFGMKVKPRAAAHGELAAQVDFDPHNASDMEQLIDAWLPIAFAVNSLNRSMGLSDLYPFVLTPKTIGKLGFVHALTHPKKTARQPSPELV
jgi:hypothetical protein